MCEIGALIHHPQVDINERYYMTFFEMSRIIKAIKKLLWNSFELLRRKKAKKVIRCDRRYYRKTKNKK